MEMRESRDSLNVIANRMKPNKPLKTTTKFTNYNPV